MLEEFESYHSFIKNKYYYWYVDLSNKIMTQNRQYDSSRHEYHHILPDCFGGTIKLPYTFREHYIAHLLLTKFTVGTDKHKMTFAVHAFFHFDRNRKLGLKNNSVMYHYYKKNFIEACKTRESPTLDKNTYVFKNRKTNQEFVGTRRQFIEANNVSSYDVNYLIRKLKENKRAHAKEWGIFNDHLNMYTFEIPRNHNDAPNRKKTCPHCNKSISLGNYSRWHGDNCKYIDLNGHILRSKQVASINKKKDN